MDSQALAIGIGFAIPQDMTKKQAKAERAAKWAAAIVDGRVVRYGFEPEISFRSFASAAYAAAFVAEMTAAEVPAVIAKG